MPRNETFFRSRRPACRRCRVTDGLGRAAFHGISPATTCARVGHKALVPAWTRYGTQGNDELYITGYAWHNPRHLFRREDQVLPRGKLGRRLGQGVSTTRTATGRAVWHGVPGFTWPRGAHRRLRLPEDRPRRPELAFSCIGYRFPLTARQDIFHYIPFPASCRWRPSATTRPRSTPPTSPAEKATATCCSMSAEMDVLTHHGNAGSECRCQPPYQFTQAQQSLMPCLRRARSVSSTYVQARTGSAHRGTDDVQAPFLGHVAGIIGARARFNRNAVAPSRALLTVAGQPARVGPALSSRAPITRKTPPARRTRRCGKPRPGSNRPGPARIPASGAWSGATVMTRPQAQRTVISVDAGQPALLPGKAGPPDQRSMANTQRSSVPFQNPGNPSGSAADLWRCRAQSPATGVTPESGAAGVVGRNRGHAGLSFASGWDDEDRTPAPEGKTLQDDGIGIA